MHFHAVILYTPIRSNPVGRIQNFSLEPTKRETDPDTHAMTAMYSVATHQVSEAE